MTQRILLTGFDAFGGETVNPSWLVAQALHGEVIGNATVVALRLPCVFGQALAELQIAVTAQRPLLVLALGQAAGRAEMTPERVAINVDDARIADNAGAAPIDTPVVARGPAAYFSTLPVKAMVAAMQQAGVRSAARRRAGGRRSSSPRTAEPLLNTRASGAPSASPSAAASQASAVPSPLASSWG